jgi:hypothetical protein
MIILKQYKKVNYDNDFLSIKEIEIIKFLSNKNPIKDNRPSANDFYR